MYKVKKEIVWVVAVVLVGYLLYRKHQRDEAAFRALGASPQYPPGE